MSQQAEQGREVALEEQDRKASSNPTWFCRQCTQIELMESIPVFWLWKFQNQSAEPSMNSTSRRRTLEPKPYLSLFMTLL